MFDLSEVKYERGGDDQLIIINAMYGGIRIGYVHCSRDGNRFGIGDLRVEKELQRRRRSILWGIVPLPNWRRPVPLRGLGIGKELLKRALREADKPGIDEVWGSVIRDDLGESPFLLEWYERHGFAIHEPDADCKGDAVKKIVRRR